MTEIIEKFLNISVGKQKTKKQIVLVHTGRDVEEYLTSLRYRMNGNYKKVPHYVITKNGQIIQLLKDIETSNYFYNKLINRNSIIVSLENLGWLEKVQLKNYYINWIDNIYKGVPHERKWRDYFMWDPYTDIQLEKTAELCKLINQKHKIKLNCVGHNTKVDGVEKFEGIITHSNFEQKITDVSPAFDFKKFITYIKDEQPV
jgi:N-acetyl-anhydromuramyl-L-alanine amidase AmpD